MSDQTDTAVDTTAQEPTSPEPVSTSPEPTPQEPAPTDDSPQEPDGFIKKERFTGAIQKIQTLTEELRTADQERHALNSQIDQLKQDLAVRDAEAQAGYGERDKKLEAALKEKQDIEARAAGLESKLRKIDMAKELGHPELVAIIDTIPTFDDDDLQRKAMEDILSFSEAQVKQREETLLAGVTPSVSPTAPTDTTPATNEAWNEAIEAEQDPQKRQALFDDWWEWREKEAQK
jgi:chromosome segregation ATPase